MAGSGWVQVAAERSASPPRLGIIADDYTGAVDLASAIRDHCQSVDLHFGLPSRCHPHGTADAVIIGLKSRSVDPSLAVSLSRRAALWLLERGASQLYFKYSSTFDSTREGNIGPVMDALTEEVRRFYGEETRAPVLVCPAVPEYGRTVYQGYLFVGDTLMSDASSESRHPLTPKQDANLVRLLSLQTPKAVGLLPWRVVTQGERPAAQKLASVQRAGAQYVVADAIEESDLSTLGAIARSHRLVTGAAGLAAALVHGRIVAGSDVHRPAQELSGAVLSGSCTETTQEQVRRFEALRPTFRFSATTIAQGHAVVGEALRFAEMHLPTGPIAVSATAPHDVVRREQDALGRDRAAQLVETALADIASGLVSLGVRKLVVAGGETSGAVVQRCGIGRVSVEGSVSPGIAWVRSDVPPLWLLLKSGPLGGADLFAQALLQNTPP